MHACPGGGQDSTHSADVDYAALLPALFSLNAGAFHIQLASEPDRPRVLRAIAEHARPGQRIFVGVIDPIDREWRPPGKSGTGCWKPPPTSNRPGQVGLNLVVPFLVSSYGYLSADAMVAARPGRWTGTVGARSSVGRSS